jgi:hypothetical protein
VHVTTTQPSRRFVLDVGDTVIVSRADGAAPVTGELRLPAEALLRLVYGRLDADNAATVVATGVELDELCQLFPGI